MDFSNPQSRQIVPPSHPQSQKVTFCLFPLTILKQFLQNLTDIIDITKSTCY